MGPPQGEALVDLDEHLAERVQVGVGVGFLVALRQDAQPPPRSSTRESPPRQKAVEGIHQTGRGQPGLEASLLMFVRVEAGQHLPAFEAETELELAELDRLKARGR